MEQVVRTISYICACVMTVFALWKIFVEIRHYCAEALVVSPKKKSKLDVKRTGF